jgi:predicted phage tail protein
LFSPLSFANFGATSVGFGSAAGIAKGFVYIGGALVLQGVSDLLTPTPQIPEAEQTPESSAFTSPLNVSMPGIAVPLVYGTAICGSIVVSTSVEVGDV